MASEKDEILNRFQAMTGTETAFALSFLEANDWKLQEAVEVFLDGGGAGGGAAASGAGTASSSSSFTSHGASGGNASNIDDDLVNRIMQQQGVDKLTAQAIAQAGGGSDGATGDDEVRAPIARTTGRLFDQGHDPSFLFGFGGHGNDATSRSNHVAFRNFEHEARQQEARARDERAQRAAQGLGTSAPTSAPNTNPRDMPSANRGVEENANYHYSNDDDDDDGDSYMREGDRNLQSIFEPPRDIMFSGSFEEARDKARSEKRWLLVNIQHDDEFFSYVLNRDLWQADMIKDVLRSSFIFFQREHKDAAAQNYVRLYKPTTFPHVGIVDARTGELVATLELKSRATEKDPNDLQALFLEKVSTFMETHSMAPVKSTTPPPPSFSSASTSAPAIAPAAAPTPAPAPSVATPAAADTVEGTGPGGRSTGEATGATGNAQDQSISYEDLEEEPAAGQEGVTQVRVRLFDGKMVNRSFLQTQKISQLFALVHSLEPGTSTRRFDIIGGYPPTSLLDKQDETLADNGLMRANLKVKWM
ncbi:UBX domain-containing protein 7 [Hondaea fermentalgiana]|uniref:UBX domain-containing protein 7 n=1 Tax=Hondaea fermentalgiana TaxID=2315210 RepID=A0A2R5GNC2_9STRA|nr:UBX domain-containing protein 7 [Hondaea fermentalgiana]|eukprot:GBG32402.1 UBX domain-containing protein 7 [Hondaea fermentalgiana]